jgi:hypothetical protein
MFEYGSIASYTADFLTGLTIEAQSVSVPKGELVIKDCTISPTDIPAGLFDPLTAAKVIRIEHAGVTTINSAAFSLAVYDNPSIRFVSSNIKYFTYMIRILTLVGSWCIAYQSRWYIYEMMMRFTLY